MNPFEYVRAADAAEAVRLGQGSTTAYLGGGTNLVDLMRETIARPDNLIDVTSLSAAIQETESGGLMIGSAVRNTALAEHDMVRSRYPVLSRAILAGASAQIRNMATVGGNLLQRTRCTYFYDTDGSSCNKRTPGSGCDAIEGFNRIHAIFGASSACVATHTHLICVLRSQRWMRPSISKVRTAYGHSPLPNCTGLPGDHPEFDTVLRPGELITAVELPALSSEVRSSYRKVRDRASYAFALVSVAAVLEMEDGHIKDVRIALGGVAHKPWRASKAEAVLLGRPLTEKILQDAASAELSDAKPLRDNGFKIELVNRTLVAVLGDITGATA